MSKLATKPTRAVGYIRVSTVKQAEEGLSAKAQEQKLQQYAELYDIRLVALERDEGLSAKTLKRPGLQRALRRLQLKQAEAVLVVKLDRLTRSVRDLGYLIDHFFSRGRWILLSVSEQIDTRTASGELVLNVLTSVSQWERKVIGERTAEVMQYKKSHGEWTGGTVPYGFKVQRGRLVPADVEQRVIRFAISHRDAGWTLEAIADELNRRGLRTRRRKPWQSAQVWRIVQRCVLPEDEA